MARWNPKRQRSALAARLRQINDRIEFLDVIVHAAELLLEAKKKCATAESRLAKLKGK